MAVDDGQLRVMDTDEPGNYGAGITDSTVKGQRVKAGVLAALSLLSVAGTVWGVRALNRHAR